MGPLYYRYNQLVQLLEGQIPRVDTLPILMKNSDEALSSMYRDLINYFDEIRTEYANEVQILFNEDYSECEVSTSIASTYIDDPETLEYLLEIKESGKPFSADYIQSFGYDDDALLDDIPIWPDEYMSSFGVGSKVDSLAVFAFDRHRKAVDLMNHVWKSQFDIDKGRWEFKSQPFLEASIEDQTKNLMDAFKEALLADQYLSRAVKLNRQLFYIKGSSPVKIDKQVEEKAKEREREKAKAGAAARHSDNYRKQEKVIEVYLSGDFRERFHKANKKTETATIILKHVNDWAEAAGIPKYQISGGGGVKTVIKTIHNYENKKVSQPD